MTEDEAATLALRHYRTTWYGQVWGANLLALWQAEYEAVSTGAFAPVLFVSSGFDGGTASAQKNFEQTARVTALQRFRGALDEEYKEAVFAAEPVLGAVERHGYAIGFC
jgi:hypothetical protein